MQGHIWDQVAQEDADLAQRHASVVQGVKLSHRRVSLPDYAILPTGGTSMLANVTGYDMRYDPRNDAEMSWHLDTAGKHMADDIQKLSK